MSGTSQAQSSSRYRVSLAAAMSAALGAGLVLVLVDVLIARSRAGDGGLDLVALTAGLYALPVLAAGLVVGLIIGAFQATYGHGALGRARRRLVEDRALDVQLTGALLAAAGVALVFAAAAAALAMILVAEVERKAVGALLLGLSLVVLAPAVATLGWPLYRVTRLVARLVPRLGPVPATLVMVVGASAAALALLGYFVFTRLEWRALNLGTYALVGLFPLAMIAWAGLWHGPLDRVRRRIPARGAITALAAAGVLALPYLTLTGEPREATVEILTEDSPGARVLVQVGRTFIDRDGDGFSPFLLGPDCDDSNPNIHPNAPEIPDNGIDDNCSGWDSTAATRADQADSAADPQDGAGAAAGAVAGATGAPAARNVLFILVDTVRADRLGVAGYTREGKSLTPRLDALAQESSYFTRAWAQSPNTPRSVPSIFTSRHPSQIAVEPKFLNFPAMLDENLTIFEILNEAGIRTLGFASHFYFNENRNVHQGFDHFDNEGALDIAGSNRDIASPRIVPKVIASLAELGASKERFAMFVHLFEPHSTYMVHEEFPITERGVPGLVQKYDYEIAYQDGWIGRILDALAEHGLAQDTMVVVLSDHGEAFGVHRVGGKKMFFHGQTLYDELLRVPLILHVPGVEPRVLDDVVMLIDVAPTVAEAMGVAIPPSFVGRSLLGGMRGEALEPRPAYGEILPSPSWNQAWRMIVSGDGVYKLIHRITDRRFELYKLDEDPDELKNLGQKEPEVRERLQRDLVRWAEEELP